VKRRVKWLFSQLDDWVQRGLLDADQAARIRQLYPDSGLALPWSTVLFTGLGAVVAGLGVILLLAYNWQAIPRLGKLGLILAALAGLHATSLWLWPQTGWRRQVGEAVGLLGTMFFGAGIWLVAQAYHIEEHFPNGFLVWGLGALAMGWTMPSVAQGLLAAVALAIWGCTEAVQFDTAVHLAPLLILAGVAGLAYWLRSLLLLAAGLVAVSVTLLFNTGVVSWRLLCSVAMNTAVLFVGVSALAARWDRFPRGGLVWRGLGWVGFLLVLYLLSFPALAAYLLQWHPTWPEPETLIQPLLFRAYAWTPFALALAAWALVAWQCRPGTTPDQRPFAGRFEHWLLPLTALGAQVTAATGAAVEEWVAAGPFNLVLLALAATWIGRGCREGALGPTALGSLLLVALVVARYFDLFESLLARGLVFLALGSILFAEGFFYRRAHRRAALPAGSS
jgi:uncharacterized membrane protein